jgi:hypothetical protein
MLYSDSAKGFYLLSQNQFVLTIAGDKDMDNKKLSGRAGKIIEDARRNIEDRDKGYREKALKLYPHVCGRCGREFSGARLKELTVHHRDHNHDNNPSDGSNWELLCIYCHDNEHERNKVAESYTQEKGRSGKKTFSSHQPFAGLADLLKEKE